MVNKNAVYLTGLKYGICFIIDQSLEQFGAGESKRVKLKDWVFLRFNF